MLFFFNDTATTEIYTLSLHDALPIFVDVTVDRLAKGFGALLILVLIKPWGLNLTWQQLSWATLALVGVWLVMARSEEHTSELQSRQYLVCRLLLEKKICIIRLSFSRS